jgi:hypothetical protein
MYGLMLVTDNFIHSDMKGSCGPSGPYTWRPSLVLSLPAAVSDSDPARRQPPHLHLVSSLSIPAAGHGGGGAGAAEPGRVPLVGLPRRRLLREARADRRGHLRVGTSFPPSQQRLLGGFESNSKSPSPPGKFTWRGRWRRTRSSPSRRSAWTTSAKA